MVKEAAIGTTIPLHQAYLLVLNIELIEWDGRFWADTLWHKDLMLHLTTMRKLTLLCPAKCVQPPADWLECRDARLTIVTLGPLSFAWYLRLPAIIYRIWKTVGVHDIVHTGVAGWPFPLGWIVAPVAKLRRRFLVIVVESSFWRASRGEPSRWRRTKAAAVERINRFCIGLCSANFFTTDAYRTELGSRSRGFKAVSPASWIDDADILSREQIAGRSIDREPRVLYAGRLTNDKGVGILLDAIDSRPAPVDFVGIGPLLSTCRALAESTVGEVRVLDPVAYGADFFALLDGYTALVVPTLTDEQPRVIADAFARGVPVIASATSGNTAFVIPGLTGWLVTPGSADELAEAIAAATADPDLSRSHGLAARDLIASFTHEAMHRNRALDIAREYDARQMINSKR